MIQLYAHINDLIPTEPRDRIYKDYNAPERIERYKPSMRKDGVMYQKRINPDGSISKGNTTYWICKDLGIDWLPVDISWFTGYMPDKHNGMVFLRPDLFDVLNEDMVFTQQPVIKNDIYKFDMSLNPPLAIPSLNGYQFKWRQYCPSGNGLKLGSVTPMLEVRI